MRLTRKQSMKRAFQFAHVRKVGSSVAGRLVVLAAVNVEPADSDSLFGIICTKKVASHAVDRNKLKRRIREIVRTDGTPLSRGLNVVCVLRWRAVDASFEELKKDWIKTAGRLLRELERNKTTEQQPS